MNNRHKQECHLLIKTLDLRAPLVATSFSWEQDPQTAVLLERLSMYGETKKVLSAR